MKEKQTKETVDKNFFKAMNYELAGEIGVLDNEDMQNNKFIDSGTEDLYDMTRFASTVDTLALLKTMKELPKK